MAFERHQSGSPWCRWKLMRHPADIRRVLCMQCSLTAACGGLPFVGPPRPFPRLPAVSWPEYGKMPM